MRVLTPWWHCWPPLVIIVIFGKLSMPVCAGFENSDRTGGIAGCCSCRRSRPRCAPRHVDQQSGQGRDHVPRRRSGIDEIGQLCRQLLCYLIHRSLVLAYFLSIRRGTAAAALLIASCRRPTIHVSRLSGQSSGNFRNGHRPVPRRIGGQFLTDRGQQQLPGGSVDLWL